MSIVLYISNVLVCSVFTKIMNYFRIDMLKN